MFKIENITLNCLGGKKRFIQFENNVSYVFAPNSKGKSLLCECIDFVLGSSDNIFNKNGMQKVESIEAVIKTDSGFLFFMRCKSVSGSIDDFYKKDENASYIQINKDLYDEKITTALLNGNDNEVVSFEEVFDRRISHRATSFLNFLDQTGMGNLKYIYTKSNSDKYRWYYKDIFNFIFNNSNIKKIVQKTRELKEKEKRLKIYRQREAKFSIQRDLLFSELQKLNINVGTITEAREALKNFELNYSRPELHSKEKDLKFLLMASQSLAEEIKVQECFNGQGKLLISRQKNIEKLLSIFQEIIEGNESFKEYITPIERILKEAKNKTDTFSTIDINQTIKKLVHEKRDIDFQIQQLNSEMIKLNYKEVEDSIAICKKLLLEIDKFGEFVDLQKLSDEIIRIRQELDDLRKKFDTASQNYISKEVTGNYNLMEETCSFVAEDFANNGFKIVFDAKSISLYGEIVEELKLGNGEIKQFSVQYNPGSMARQTTWQILCYLSIMKFALTRFSGLPVIPLLVFDNISMPYDVKDGTNNYNSVYNLIKEYADKNNIQVVLTSNVPAIDVGEKQFINIAYGLNPAF